MVLARQLIINKLVIEVIGKRPLRRGNTQLLMTLLYWLQPDRGNVDHWCNLCFGKLIPRSPLEAPASSVTDSSQSVPQGDSRIRVGDTINKLPSVNSTAASSGTASSGTTSSGTASSGTPPLLTIIANMDQVSIFDSAHLYDIR